MTCKIRKPRTLKNTILTSRYYLSLMVVVVFFTLSLSHTIAAQETVQWRRTKDGWIDMTQEFHQMTESQLKYEPSPWDSIWPTAATLCLVVGAYGVLTFDFRSSYREIRAKLSRKPLGRGIRQSDKTPVEMERDMLDGTIPALIPITAENPHTPHR
jgi:hypothetical protein